MRRILSIWIASAAWALLVSSAHATVSVEEIVRLNSVGMSEQSLLLVVSASDTPDTISTAQLTLMIEANVPDTVIATMVAKADAVMEDWKPVDVDQALEQQKVLTETEVYNVYPGWGGYWGWPGYGWCGTYNNYSWPGYWYDPWYSYPYPAPYGGFYLGYGWGGWSVGFSWGWGGGYCGYYDPWYYGGGYCGYYDPYPYYPYYPYDDDYTYREIDRPNYHNGADRGTQRGVTPTPYRQDPSTGTGTRSEIAGMDTRQVTSIDRSAKTNTGSKDVRGGVDGSTRSTRSEDNLKRITSPRTEKATLQTADQGSGKYVIKGEDKKVRGDGEMTTPTLNSPGSKARTSGALDKGQAQSGKSVKSDVTTGLNRAQQKRSAGSRDQVAEATRTLTRETRVSGGQGKTTAEQVNRYVKMKAAQNGSGISRASRSTASRATGAGSGSKSSNPVRLADKTPSSTGSAVQERAPAVHKSTAAPKSSGRSAPSKISGSG